MLIAPQKRPARAPAWSASTGCARCIVRAPEGGYGAPAKPRLLDEVCAEVRKRHCSSRS